MSLSPDEVDQVLSIVEGVLSKHASDLEDVRKDLDSLKKQLLERDESNVREELVNEAPPVSKPQMDFFRVSTSVQLADAVNRLLRVNQAMHDEAFARVANAYVRQHAVGKIASDRLSKALEGQRMAHERMAKLIQSHLLVRGG